MKHQTRPVEPNQGLHRQIIMCTQKREQSMAKVNRQTFFGDFIYHLILKEAQCFETLCLCVQSEKHLTC